MLEKLKGNLAGRPMATSARPSVAAALLPWRSQGLRHHAHHIHHACAVPPLVVVPADGRKEGAAPTGEWVVAWWQPRASMWRGRRHWQATSCISTLRLCPCWWRAGGARDSPGIDLHHRVIDDLGAGRIHNAAAWVVHVICSPQGRKAGAWCGAAGRHVAAATCLNGCLGRQTGPVLHSQAPNTADAPVETSGRSSKPRMPCR